VAGHPPEAAGCDRPRFILFGISAATRSKEERPALDFPAASYLSSFEGRQGRLSRHRHEDHRGPGAGRPLWAVHSRLDPEKAKAYFDDTAEEAKQQGDDLAGGSGAQVGGALEQTRQHLLDAAALAVGALAAGTAAGRSEGHDPLQLNPAVELGCGRADHCQQRLLEQHGKRTRGAVGVRQLGGETLAPGR
jgi:hypothetical protein